MAQAQRSLLFVSVFLILTCSNAFHEQLHFQDFDVSSSVAKTCKIFSGETLNMQEEKHDQPTTNTTHAVLSLSLHTQVSISKPHHKDYHDLTLSRLAHDSVRVNSINARLHLALSNFTQSGLQTPVVSGFNIRIGEYLARIGVGQPAKFYYMILDTGSHLTWLQCQPCVACYRQFDPIFDPRASHSYRPLPCSSQQCTSLQNHGCSATGCTYQIGYGDGSWTDGDFATETLTFGNSGAVNNAAIGCGHENKGSFIGADGILGLGGSFLSFPSQIRASSFSYCLVDYDSFKISTLDFNSSSPKDSIIVSMAHNPIYDVYYYIDLIGISVGDERLQIPPPVFQIDPSGHGGIILDSGTTVTQLTNQAYNPLRDTFVKYTQDLPRTDGFSVFDTCYNFSSIPSVSVPKIAFHFSGGQTLQLRAENYLVPVDNKGKFCLAFMSTPDALSIIGNIQQQGMRVSYDLGRRLIGFSPNKC